jgi:hypothetical protein
MQPLQNPLFCSSTIVAMPPSLYIILLQRVNCSSLPSLDCGLELTTVTASWHYVTVHSAAVIPVEFAISVELTGTSIEITFLALFCTFLFFESALALRIYIVYSVVSKRVSDLVLHFLFHLHLSSNSSDSRVCLDLFVIIVSE